MGNKAWFFGDSFTQGWSDDKIELGFHTLQEDYFINVLNSNGQRWTEILASKLKLEHINCAEGGYGNEDIIFQITDKLQYIKPGDTVVMSNSHELRFQIPKYDGNLIVPFNAAGLETGDVSDYHNDFVKDFKLVKEVLVDYATEFRAKHHMTWRWYFLDRFRNLEAYFKEFSINAYFWHFDIWMFDKPPHVFERISEHTNNRLLDYHFSERGHKDFAEYFLNNLDLMTLLK